MCRYKLLKIQEYEMTRDLILENLDNHQILTVFDDTDLVSNKFDFLQVGKVYNCKILLFARSKLVAKLYKKSPTEFTFLGKEIIGQKERLKIQDRNGTVLYISQDFEPEIEMEKIFLIPLRYDILAVNGIERT